MPWFHHSSNQDRDRSHSVASSIFGVGGGGGSADGSPFVSAPPSRTGSPQPLSSYGAATGNRVNSATDYPPGDPIGSHGDQETPAASSQNPSSYFPQVPLTPSSQSAFSFNAAPLSSASSFTTQPLSAGGMHGLTGTSTNPALFQAPPLEIMLDNDHLVLRGQGGETNPALLTGQLVLNLNESTNIRELSLRLEGKAKIAFIDTSG